MAATSIECWVLAQSDDAIDDAKEKGLAMLQGLFCGSNKK
jgi:hypothetical protein